MGLRPPLARADDVRAKARDARTLDVGEFVVLERAEPDEQLARIGRPLRHRSPAAAQPARPPGLLPCRGAVLGLVRLAAALPGGGRSVCCTSPRGAAASSSCGAPGTASTAAWLSAGSTSSRTRTAASAGKRSSVAVRRVTSISRCGVAGPRSLMRTSTWRPFSRLVSRTTAGSCSVWCAAASAVWSNASPSAVSSAWPDG